MNGDWMSAVAESENVCVVSPREVAVGCGATQARWPFVWPAQPGNLSTEATCTSGRALQAGSSATNRIAGVRGERKRECV